MEAIDDIMERKIGFGTYQKRALGFLCLIDFNDGLELILMSLTLPIIRSEWNSANIQSDGTQYITSFIFKWLGSIFFMGNLIGAILTGPLSDKFGRRTIVLWTSAAYGIIAFSFAFVQSLSQLFILRLLYGFVYGITLPLSTTYYAEIVPSKMRGKGVVLINSAIAIGMITAVIVASIILTDTSSGNWRALISISSIPALILFYGTYTYMLESPRYLIVEKRIQEAAEVMNQMIEINLGDGGELITEDEMKSLEEWRQRKFDQTDISSQTGSTTVSDQSRFFQLAWKISQLFVKRNKYFIITTSLCVQWFGIHLMSIGQIFILPLIQEQAKKGFTDMFITFLGEIPGFMITYLIIDKAILGRKNSLQLFFAGAAVLNLLAYFQISFGIVLGLGRLCYRQCHGVLYVITNEVYETPMRSSGMGLTSALGRLATVVMPFILVAIFEVQHLAPFLFFSIIAAVCSFMAYLLPFDTCNMKLDHVNEEASQIDLNLGLRQGLILRDIKKKERAN